MPVLGEIVGWEILVPLVLIVLLFGSGQIPKVARSLGQASKEFHKGLEAGQEETGDESEPTT